MFRIICLCVCLHKIRVRDRQLSRQGSGQNLLNNRVEEEPGNFVFLLPCPGKITTLHKPGGPGVRVDTHAYAHYVIPPYYDSLIAKVITHGKNREEAINRMERALEEFIIEGIKTTIPLHQAILRNTNFREGNFSTRFLQNFDFNSIGGSE